MLSDRFDCDGNTRRATSITEIVPGMILRPIQSDGSVSPFSDVVVTKTYIDHGETRFDVARPYAFSHFGGELHGVEKVAYLSISSLIRYHIVLKASGKPYMMDLGG
jgi:hypothetical protein